VYDWFYPKEDLNDSTTEADRNSLEDGSAASPGRRWLVRRRFLDGPKSFFTENLKIQLLQKFGPI